MLATSDRTSITRDAQEVRDAGIGESTARPLSTLEVVLYCSRSSGAGEAGGAGSGAGEEDGAGSSVVEDMSERLVNPATPFAVMGHPVIVNSRYE